MNSWAAALNEWKDSSGLLLSGLRPGLERRNRKSNLELCCVITLRMNLVSCIAIMRMLVTHPTVGAIWSHFS